MLRKAVFFGLILIAAGTVFAGGGGQQTAAAGGPVTVRWLMQVGTESEAGQWRELAADVTKRFPEITVDMATTDWNGYWAKLPTELAGGNPPDILYMQSMRASSFIEEGFEPLDPFLAADTGVNLGDFYKGILDGLSSNGKLYCLPYDFGPQIIFYNIDLFNKHGVALPGSKGFDLPGYMKAIETLSKNGDFGVTVIPNVDRWIPFVWNEGITFFNSSGKFVVNDPKVVAVIQRQTDFIRNNMAPRQTTTGNNNWDKEQFYAGNVGMQMGGTWDLNVMKNYATKFKFGIMMVPGGSVRQTTPIAGSGFGIAKDSRHKAEAYKAITSLTSPESLTKLAGWGRALPARGSVRDVFYQQNLNVPGLRETVEASLLPGVGLPYVTTKNWQEVFTAITQNLETVFLGSETPQAALDNAQKLIDGILGQ